MAGAQPFVDNKIKQRKVMLFSKSYCPFSKIVKEILESYNFTPGAYEAVEIEKRQDVNQIEDYFQILSLTDSRSTPQLFVDGKYVGDEANISRLHEAGKLADVFKAAEVVAA